MAEAKDEKKPTGLHALNLPPLEGGWVIIAEAAKMLGVTRQHAYRLVRDGELADVRRLGTSDLYVVKTSEVERRLQTLADKADERASRALDRELAKASK